MKPNTNAQRLELNKTIQNRLQVFLEYLNENDWMGREREAISLFAFKFLMESCKPDSLLNDPVQIGIEVAVPQVKKTGYKQKPQVCKDLVIWPEPGMTCWDSEGKPTNYPLCILEWKFYKKEEVQGDVDWLIAFSNGRKEFTGYSVYLESSEEGYTIDLRRIYDGKEETGGDWPLHLPAVSKGHHGP